MQRGEFTITAQLQPQSGSHVAEVVRQAAMLATAVDGIQLPESPPDQTQVSQVALCALMLRSGIDATPRLHCRERNRIALQSELLGFRAIGVTSIILERGGRLPDTEGPIARPVFDASCRELVAMAQDLNEETTTGAEHDLLIGTSTSAFSPPADWNADTLFARAGAGAQFLLTRPCFDGDMLRQYMQRLVELKLTWSYSVIVTLAALPNVEAVYHLVQEGQISTLPDPLLERLDSAGDPEAEGISICAELMREFAEIPGVSGINLLAMDNPEAIATALDASGLRATG